MQCIKFMVILFMLVINSGLYGCTSLPNEEHIIATAKEDTNSVSTITPEEMSKNLLPLSLNQCLGSWQGSFKTSSGQDGEVMIYIYCEEDNFFLDMLVQATPGADDIQEDTRLIYKEQISEINNIGIVDYEDDYQNYGKVIISPQSDTILISVSVESGYRGTIPCDTMMKMNSISLQFIGEDNVIKPFIELKEEVQENQEIWEDAQPIDPYENVSELEYKTMLEQRYAYNVPNVERAPEPINILRNFENYKNQPIMYEGNIRWVSSYESQPKSFLLEKRFGGFIVSCNTDSNIPMVEGDYIKVYGEPDSITSYTSTENIGNVKEMPTFNIKVRYWTINDGQYYSMNSDEKTYFFNHTYRAYDNFNCDYSTEFYFTENTINNQSYEVKNAYKSNGEIILDCTSEGERITIFLSYAGTIAVAYEDREKIGPFYFYNKDIHNK